MTSDPTTIISIAAACAIAMLIMLVVRLADSRRRSRRQRRFARVQLKSAPAPQTDSTPRLKRGDRASAIPGLDALIRTWLPRPGALRARLARTGRDISIAEYVLGCLASWAVATWAMTHFVGLPPRIAVLAAAAVGLLLPHMIVNRLIQRRMKKFTDQFADAIDLIVRSLKSGLPIPEAIRAVGTEMQDPVATEFRAVAERVNVGMQLEEALWSAADRIGTAEFRFFVVSLSVQRETGGNLAETLENLSDLLRRRRQMHLKIKAMSSEARASAFILGSLPFTLFGILALVNPEYVFMLFHDARGILMVAAGLVSLLIGVLVMAKMIRFEI